MLIQPVNKAVEHLINSTPVLGGKRKKKKEVVNAYLIKNSKGEGCGGGVGGWGHSDKQSEGLGGVLRVYKIGLK